MAVDLNLPAQRFADYLAGQGLPVRNTIAFAGLSTLTLVDTSGRPGAGGLGVAKGLSGYYHVIEAAPADVKPGVYGYYWYQRFGSGQHDTWRAAFEFEFATLQSLAGHDNWAHVWWGDMNGAIPYYVMRYYECGSLASLGAAFGWDLPVSLVLSVGTDIARALAALHASGVVHRDLNAENVLLADDGRAVVADLGCARRLDAPPVEPRRRTDEFHWPPEYADAYDVAGVQADVYSLGVLLYQMTVGRMPRHGGPQAASAVHAGRFPRVVTELVDACLAYEPGNRPESVDKILAEFAAA
jgi:serine/threonine protein kinase